MGSQVSRLFTRNRQSRPQGQPESHNSGTQPEERSEPQSSEENTRPEEQRIRVIGGSECLTPGEAMRMPELYRVVRDGDRHVIYTNEFYETLPKDQTRNAPSGPGIESVPT
jgi:hypothetical protein